MQTTLVLEPANQLARDNGQTNVQLEAAGEEPSYNSYLYPGGNEDYLVSFPITIPADPGEYIYAYYPQQQIIDPVTGNPTYVSAGSLIQFTIGITNAGGVGITI